MILLVKGDLECTSRWERVNHINNCILDIVACLFCVLMWTSFIVFAQDPPANITVRLIPNSNKLNGTLEIVCSADGNPAPRSFRWFMDGKFIKNTTGNVPSL